MTCVGNCICAYIHAHVRENLRLLCISDALISEQFLRIFRDGYHQRNERKEIKLNATD